MPPLVLAAALLEGLALTLIQGYLPLYVRQVLGEVRYVTIALVVAVPAFGTVIASNFWGGLSDVTGRLKPMVLVGLAGYVAALVCVPGIRSGLQVLYYVGAASLLYGTLSPSLKTYITLLRPGRTEHSLAYLLMSQSTGWLMGSLGVGWLLDRGLGPGLQGALRGCGALLAVQLLVSALWLGDLRRQPAAARRRGWLEGVARDLASLYENPRLLQLCVLAFLFVSANFAMWGFYAVFMVERLGADIRLLRYAIAVSAVSGILSFPFVGPVVRRFGGGWVIAIALVGYLVMYLGVGLTRSPVVAAALFALPLYGFVNVSANTLASEYSTAGQRGGGLGVLSGTYAIATVAGPVACGLLADRVGLRVVPWVAFAFMAAATPLGWGMAIRGSRGRDSGESALIGGSLR
jgi:MFS family permease